MTGWARGVNKVVVYAVTHGRLSSCLVFSDFDKRLLIDGVSDGKAKKFKARAPAIAWLVTQDIDPQWCKSGLNRYQTTMEVDAPDLPERVEFVPHPTLNARQMRVAMGAFDPSDVSDTELAESDVELGFFTSSTLTVTVGPDG